MTARPDDTARQRLVLIVDDERRNRQVLEVMLLSDGYRVAMASSGDEALAQVAREQPDLVLLDVMMPGMDGYQIASILKGNPATAGIPVMLLSSLDDSNSRAHGLRSGADEFLSKPVNRAELCERVRRLLSPDA